MATIAKPTLRSSSTVGQYRICENAVLESISRLSTWLDHNHYQAYDTFDGLNATLLRPLTFNNKYLRTVLQQGVRRFPVNLRPLLGIKKSHSSKGMAFLARGFMRLYEATGEEGWRARAEYPLQWLLDNQSKGYSGSCWGNHFDYQARGDFYLPRGVPTVVWTSLIGHAFLDAYEHFRDNSLLMIAASACEHIRLDVPTVPDRHNSCICYTPIHHLSQVHNASMLAAGFLARTYSYTKMEPYRELASKAVAYTAQYQRPDSSWYYGEATFLRWIDNFHTAYVLDSFKHYIQSTGDDRYFGKLMSGYEYWKRQFFLPDGTPRYYSHKTLPIDIQCCSQAIDTLVFFRDLDPNSLKLALNVAKWTIDHMQDRDGHFYYRRYFGGIVNKTPTLHWGQATMLCALAGLYGALQGERASL